MVPKLKQHCNEGAVPFLTSDAIRVDACDVSELSASCDAGD